MLLGPFRNKFRKLSEKSDGLIRSLRICASDPDNLDERLGLTLTTADNEQQRHLLMIKQARRDHVAIISRFGVRLMGGEGVMGKDTLRAVMRAKQRGVRIRIIAEVDEFNREYAGRLSHYAELRQLQDVLFYFHIFDKRELIIGPASSTDDEIRVPERVTRNSDLWTNNRRFIQGMYSMFEKLWSVSAKT
jgi:phosphatidylserine/phosphatidylglycerophosphate/cardiolipin synthase-like enzyme